MVRTNKQGQSLGRKGSESRHRLIAAARELVGTLQSDRLTVRSISQAAGLASQTFYLYFKDVDELLLVLSREASNQIGEVAAVLAMPWEREALEAWTSQFIAAFYRYWDSNRAVLTLRNFRADTGHADYLAVRNETMQPIVRGLAKRIIAAQGSAEVSERDAAARAIVIVAAIERMASRYSATMGADGGALDSLDFKRAEAHILLLMLSPLPQ
ncbi:TetR/AcrR family transcriptional regulator [Sphingomonas flavalba]|uniref:TetR/AcrR family transcriptional regulator n=1 Tax=Sphingomonas flavalba TaxID=2559804 RepID=UPI0039E03F97